MLKIIETSSILNKISIQCDANRSKFICSKCSTFSTVLRTEFESHLHNHHSDFNRFKCVYCDSNFDCSSISDHIESHFDENRRSTNICTLCNVSIETDSRKSIIDHLIGRHNKELVCPICRTQFTDESQLIDHIDSNFTTTYRCNFDNCRMKTTDIDQLNRHRKTFNHLAESWVEERTFNCRSIKIEAEIVDEPVVLVNEPDEIQAKVVKSIDRTRPDQFDVVWQLVYRKDLSDLTLTNHNQSKLFAEIEKKLSTLDSFAVGFSLGGGPRLYWCLSCEFAPQLSHWVVKKHVLIGHLALSKKHAAKVIRFIEFKRDNNDRKSLGSINQSMTQAADDKPPETKRNKRTKFQQVFHVRCDWAKFDELRPNVCREKLEQIERYSIGVMHQNQRKQFYCSDCGRRWAHSHWNTRKHLLMDHCGLGEAEMRLVISLVTLVDSADKSISIASDDASLTSLRIHSINSIDLDQSLLSLDQSIISIDQNLNQSLSKKPRSNYNLQIKCRWDLFRKTFRHLDRSASDSLRQKMSPVDSVLIGVRFVKDKRSFHCLLCSYRSLYSSWDVRRHMLVSHFGISQQDSCRAVKIIDLVPVADSDNKNPPPVDNNNNPDQVLDDSIHEQNIEYRVEPTNTDIDDNRESFVDIDRLEAPFRSVNGSIYRLTYSRPKLRALFRKSDRETRVDIERKMDIYERCVAQKVKSSAGKSGFYYLCAMCGYKSLHQLADVKKHIMGVHCGIHALLLRDCLQASLAELEQDQPESEHRLNRSIDNDNKSTKNVIKRNKRRESCPPVVLFEKLSAPIETRKRKADNLEQVEEPTTKKSRLSPSAPVDLNRSEITADVPATEPRKIIIDREIELNYSSKILDKLFEIENVKRELSDMRNKLDSIYRRTRVRIGRKYQSELFLCSICHWFSGKSIDNVTGHIIEAHLDIDQSLVPIVMKATRMDSSYRLMSDREISAEGWNGEPILTKFR